MGKRKINYSSCSDITKRLLKISTSQGVDKAFTTFIEFLATFLASDVDPINGEERKMRYQEINDSLSADIRKEYLELIDLVKQTFAENADDPVDILGEVFHELNLHNAWHGQFFTPNDVARLMAMLINPTSKEDDGIASLHEPTCGSGTIVIAAARAMKNNGEDYSKKLLVVAQDIDIRCVWMSYIQLSLYNIPAVIIHGNSLTDEVWAKWCTANYSEVAGGALCGN